LFKHFFLSAGGQQQTEMASEGRKRWGELQLQLMKHISAGWTAARRV